MKILSENKEEVIKFWMMVEYPDFGIFK